MKHSTIGFGLVMVSMALGGTLAACGDDTTTPTPDAGTADATQETGSGGDTGMPPEASPAETGGDDGGSDSSPADTGMGAESAGDDGGGEAGVAEGSTGEAGGDGGIDAARTLDCPSYCALVTQNCTGANAQYGSASECLNACSMFPPGALADTANDTLGCRIYHAGLAASLPNPHCWHAGPYGFGVCGTQCEDFCLLAATWCSPTGGFDSGAAPYMNTGECSAKCMMFANVDAGAGVPGAYNAAGPTMGNTLDCREWHLGKALVDHTSAGQQTHCNHVGMTSPTCM